MNEVWLNPLGYGPVLLNSMAAAGWRIFMVDLEHNFLTEEQLHMVLHFIKSADCDAVVRPSNLDAHHIGRLFEAGARRFLLPGVESARSLETIVENLQAHPKAHEGFRLIPMIESAQALEIAHELCDIKGVTGIHFGPFDLARSLELPDWRDMDALLPVILPVIPAIRARGKTVGMYVLPKWFPSFPFDQFDIGSLGLHELVPAAGILPLIQSKIPKGREN